MVGVPAIGIKALLSPRLMTIVDTVCGIIFILVGNFFCILTIEGKMTYGKDFVCLKYFQVEKNNNMLNFVRFVLLSASFWTVFYLVKLSPEQQKLQDLGNRSVALQSEIDKIERNLHYLQAEREVLDSNNRFYIKRLIREKLRLQPKD